MEKQNNHFKTTTNIENKAYRQTCYELIDLDEMQRSNLLISGCNNSGKTNLACQIVSILQKFNWRIIAFDSSGAWLKQSDIPIYTTVEYDYRTESFRIPLFNESVIYDMTMLLPSEQKLFVDMVVLDLWHRQLETENKEWVLVALEESQLYMKNVRSQVAENLLRTMSVGRNQKIRVLAVTPDLALIDSAFIRLCGQRFHGRLSIEENGLRKFRYYYGSDWVKVTREHDIGLFTYLCRDKLKVVSVGYFKAQTKPTNVTKLQKVSILQKIKSLIYNRRD